MDFSDERYVRVFTRDTPTMKLLRWEGRMVFFELLRKVDRAGVLDFGDEGVFEAVSAVTDIPLEYVLVGLQRVLDRGCAVVQERSLVIQKFLEAQETTQSDNHRKRESRARRRDFARHGIAGDGGGGVTKTDVAVPKPDTPPKGAVPPVVPKPDVAVPKPTGGVPKPTENVTPCLAVPSRAVPSSDRSGRKSSKTLTSSQPETSDAGGRADAGGSEDSTEIPRRPERKRTPDDLMPKTVPVSEYVPLPGHTDYAVALGLTEADCQRAFSELRVKGAEKGRPRSLERWDLMYASFLEQAARTKESKPKTNAVAPVTALPTTKKKEWGPMQIAMFGNQLDDDYDGEDEVKQA